MFFESFKLETLQIASGETRVPALRLAGHRTQVRDDEKFDRAAFGHPLITFWHLESRYLRDSYA
ncbi:hypothetical protein [Rhizobium leguminosarum]|uniref:hypothetical protein n=1 Tax=Rhizobium leguminosarum TaxID=384 RepID=UPI00098F6051|nr:hypothetical protein [Rhizobium leguminosarum]MBB5261764.1 hypothetical protein [Rhizobium leguminosarum]MBY5485384.1 hypothetical protein [Rhizobium leguminosarum]MDX6000595.1 hypothetical protein [Rhizobium leguminosarum]OOO44762.1 hypothetical protein BS629_26425 [Rhizobium leguminosarum bv. viciae USDA 2370]PUB64897.1 hypothetical protein DB728_09290 [Rhizobium leguminosarum bv. viciae USDA 2370]